MNRQNSLFAAAMFALTLNALPMVASPQTITEVVAAQSTFGQASQAGVGHVGTPI
jgi:hypothetical protein